MFEGLTKIAEVTTSSGVEIISVPTELLFWVVAAIFFHAIFSGR